MIEAIAAFSRGLIRSSAIWLPPENEGIMRREFKDLQKTARKCKSRVALRWFMWSCDSSRSYASEVRFSRCKLWAVVNPSARLVGFNFSECPSDFKAGIPLLCIRINAPANLQNVWMIAKLCGDFLQFLVGFDVFAEFEPAEADLK